MAGISGHRITVFPDPSGIGGQGGNPTTIFLDADNLTPAEMQSLAQKAGHECGFVLSGSDATSKSQNDQLTIKYWVPGHEMEMCGHATVGSIWLMEQLGMLSVDKIRVSTLSGEVEAKILGRGEGSDIRVLVSQPKGSVEDLSETGIPQVVKALGISIDGLDSAYKIQNGRTSRTKTFIPLKSIEVLDDLQPDPALIQQICKSIGSTGLYPYAIIDASNCLFSARQFPVSSGYLEDPATGIAAAALVFSLLDNSILSPESQQVIKVRQGWAMGRPSQIEVQLRRGVSGEIDGCWITGAVQRIQGILPDL